MVQEDQCNKRREVALLRKCEKWNYGSNDLGGRKSPLLKSLQSLSGLLEVAEDGRLDSRWNVTQG